MNPVRALALSGFAGDGVVLGGRSGTVLCQLEHRAHLPPERVSAPERYYDQTRCDRARSGKGVSTLRC